MIALLAAAMLVPQSAPIGDAKKRVRDPVAEHAPEEVQRGYALFENTAGRYTRAKLSCGSCHLNAGQKDGALPLVGIASVFPEYNKRAGRMFTIEDRVVG